MVPRARRAALALLALLVVSSPFRAQSPPSQATAEQAAELLRTAEAMLTRFDASAVAAFEAAETAARSAAAQRELGRALTGLSAVILGSNRERAMAAARESVRIHEALGDNDGLADAWNAISNAHYYGGEYGQAIEAAKRALEFWTAAGNRVGMARALGNIGNNYSSRGHLEQAAEYMERSLTIFEELGDRRRAAVVTGNIAVLQHRQGNLPEALELSRRSLAMREALGDTYQIAKGLDTLGVVYRDLGAYGRALEALQRGLELRMQSTDYYAIAESEHNIGLVYFSQGNYDRAIEAYKRGIALSRKAGTTAIVPEALTNIGAAAWGLGQFTRARANFLASLAIAEREGYQSSLAANLAALGHLALEQNRLQEADRMFARALPLHESNSDRRGIVITLNGIAGLQLRRRQFEEALATATRAAESARRFEQNEELWSALTLAGTAQRRLGRMVDARRSFREAIAVVERLRSDLAGRPVERDRFLATKLSPYHELIALRSAEAPAEALEIAERARARALGDMMQAGGTLALVGRTASERREEQRLQAALRAVNRRIIAERTRELPDAQRVATFEGERERLRADYDAFQTELYTRRPEIRRGRGAATPFSVAEAAALVTPTTAVLEFVVSDESTYAFVLTNTGERPDVASHRVPISRTRLASLVRSFRSRIAARDLLFSGDARELHDLLVAPVRHLLAGKAHLIIVPDGPLWETPFQALKDRKGRYLIEAAAISYVPSLTILRDRIRGARPRPSARTVLAMGKANFGTTRKPPAQLMSDLAPLPEAERQVKQLTAIYGLTRSRVYTGDNATEERFKLEAPGYGIVHVASHGLFDEASPLYSSIVLSAGASADDGLLEAWELLDLDLQAELVILSACETGRGRIASGEGVVGTTWALLAAGAHAAVVSQWKVEASSTTQLMTAFHRRLAAEAGSKADHLRGATLEIMRNPRYTHPFYWAPFILVGS